MLLVVCIGMKKYKKLHFIGDADKAKRQKSHTDVFPPFVARFMASFFTESL
jgi:hypothetical protein